MLKAFRLDVSPRVLCSLRASREIRILLPQPKMVLCFLSLRRPSVIPDGFCSDIKQCENTLEVSFDK